ncbi:hypothetical protein RND71_027554 [Anisodus tanguticus]|uniref:Uncharacterized protein n=1 Tax=Anisodus tanguticus TaxID=243964 RepID=A0AAE1RHU3_9SOLA|nr:hypothetical protein RND71_027554 [Anisodus tanguticus]
MKITGDGETSICQASSASWTHGDHVVKFGIPCFVPARAMKKVAKEIDDVVEEWLVDHKRKKDSKEIKYGDEEGFMDVMLSICENRDLPGFDAYTAIKGTCSASGKPSDEAIDMSESSGLTILKATPLEVLLALRLSPVLYE